MYIRTCAFGEVNAKHIMGGEVLKREGSGCDDDDEGDERDESERGMDTVGPTTGWGWG